MPLLFISRTRLIASVIKQQTMLTDIYVFEFWGFIMLWLLPCLLYNYGVDLLSDLIYQFVFVFLGPTRVAQGSTTEGQNCF